MEDRSSPVMDEDRRKADEKNQARHDDDIAEQGKRGERDQLKRGIHIEDEDARQSELTIRGRTDASGAPLVNGRAGSLSIPDIRVVAPRREFCLTRTFWR